MPEKQRFNLSLAEHIAEKLETYSEPLSSTPTEYAALIIRKWYADGCPPVTEEEARLRAERSPKAKATPKAS